ncbi:hypothetical protein FA95DRAFT_1571806 [Auriscalpium vulgare]|uniref:Uncharacterized protein n=1 Tax=Auriscalpium vulgare TaxID=40419 RepID=A0ACB8RW75_9AGAM|nr:hypothetical protein FA95DRAFT_1571806 [Auriscalpium vulgare]
MSSNAHNKAHARESRESRRTAAGQGSPAAIAAELRARKANKDAADDSQKPKRPSYKKMDTTEESPAEETTHEYHGTNNFFAPLDEDMPDVADVPPTTQTGSQEAPSPTTPPEQPTPGADTPPPPPPSGTPRGAQSDTSDAPRMSPPPQSSQQPPHPPHSSQEPEPQATAHDHQGQNPPPPKKNPSRLGSLAARLAAKQAHSETVLPTSATALGAYHPGPFPLIERAHPLAIYDRTPISQSEAWERIHNQSKEGYSTCIVSIFDLTLENTDFHPMIISKVKTAFKELTSEEVSVAAPRKVDDDTLLSHILFIYDVSEQAVSTMLTRRIISSDAITFEVLPLWRPIPHHLVALTGFTEGSAFKIACFLAAQWSTDEAIRRLEDVIVKETEEGNTSMTPDEAFDILMTVRVEKVDLLVHGGYVRSRYNCFGDTSPLRDDRDWYILHNFVRNDIAYASDLYGTAFIADPMTCTLCHGTGHHRSLCPFPATQGWRGPVGSDNPHQMNSKALRERAKEDKDAKRSGFVQTKKRGPRY